MTSDNDSDHKEIERLAYTFWQERGCPLGSPEVDWLRAEKEMREVEAAAPPLAQSAVAVGD